MHNKKIKAINDFILKFRKLVFLNIIFLEQYKVMNTKIILDFLAELSKNNNKLWLDAHRAEYTEAKNSFYELTTEFIKRLTALEPAFERLDAKQCIYRLNRDIRFSPDKTPYKNHFAAYINDGGKNNWSCGYYVHLQCRTGTAAFDGSMLACGLHCPAPEWLYKVRQHIADNGAKLIKILNNKQFKASWDELEGDSLKKAPRDFDPNDPYIQYLKMKSFAHYNRCLCANLWQNPPKLQRHNALQAHRK
jgi:uncharacterized protein (TIGR02453 family)